METQKIYSQKRGTRKAFTLPEIVISISVIVMVITAASDILISVMRSNSENINTLIAYGLAQEGIEAMRNIRDSNWKLGLDFDGSKPGDNQELDSIWNNLIFDLSDNSKKYFSLYRRATQTMETCGQQDLLNCTPWQLAKVNAAGELKSDSSGQIQMDVFNGGDLEKLIVYKSKQEETGNLMQTNLIYNQFTDATLMSGFEKTSFHRVLEVEKLCFDLLSGPQCQSGDNENMKFRVSSIVVWKMPNGQQKQLILTSELTDWKND